MNPAGENLDSMILAVAVFLDALCIRLILLPVILRLTGHSAWLRHGRIRSSPPTRGCRRVRGGGRTVDVHMLVATAVNAEGFGDSLGPQGSRPSTGRGGRTASG